MVEWSQMTLQDSDFYFSTYSGKINSLEKITKPWEKCGVVKEEGQRRSPEELQLLKFNKERGVSYQTESIYEALYQLLAKQQFKRTENFYKENTKDLMVFYYDFFRKKREITFLANQLYDSQQCVSRKAL